MTDLQHLTRWWILGANNHQAERWHLPHANRIRLRLRRGGQEGMIESETKFVIIKRTNRDFELASACSVRNTQNRERSAWRQPKGLQMMLMLLPLHPPHHTTNRVIMAFRRAFQVRSHKRFTLGQQRRNFLGLQRPPPPKPGMMGYLVAQGLAIVLLADLAFATVINEPTTIRSLCQTVGFWKEPAAFEKIHHKNQNAALED